MPGCDSDAESIRIHPGCDTAFSTSTINGLREPARAQPQAQYAKYAKYTLDSMRPHTHTRRAAHAPASHLEPNRTSKPKSKLREARVCDIAQTAHAPRLLRAEARSSQRTQDRMWFDLSSQTATQTRASNEARNDGPLWQRARELRHRVLGAVHAVVLDSTARPRLLDLQLPRRRQTSCPALLLVAFGEIEPGMLSSWIQFVSASKGVHVVCAREAHTVRSVCGAVPTRGATNSRAAYTYLQPGASF